MENTVKVHLMKCGKYYSTNLAMELKKGVIVPAEFSVQEKQYYIDGKIVSISADNKLYHEDDDIVVMQVSIRYDAVCVNSTPLYVALPSIPLGQYEREVLERVTVSKKDGTVTNGGVTNDSRRSFVVKGFISQANVDILSFCETETEKEVVSRVISRAYDSI